MKEFYNENEKDSQMMLLPDIITLNHKQMDIARDNMMLFKKAGFEVEEFGDNTIKLSGVPSICIELDTKELFHCNYSKKSCNEKQKINYF